MISSGNWPALIVAPLSCNWPLFGSDVIRRPPSTLAGTSLASVSGKSAALNVFVVFSADRHRAADAGRGVVDRRHVERDDVRRLIEVLRRRWPCRRCPSPGT